MAKTVPITKTRSRFVNFPASFEVGDLDDGSSCLVSSREYTFPDGYHVAKTSMGEDAIFDAADRCCEIVEHSSGLPQLVSGDRKMPVLAAK